MLYDMDDCEAGHWTVIASCPHSLQVNEIAYWVAEKMNAIAHEVLYNSDMYKSLQQKHSVEGKPFVMQVSLWGKL